MKRILLLILCLAFFPLIVMATGAQSHASPVQPKNSQTSQPHAASGQPKINEAPPVPSDVAVEHIVVVVEENHSYAQIIDNKKAPYLNALAKRGALFTDAHGVAHPSQPNYLALFSGSTQDIKNDSCPHRFTTPNLASELISAERTFGGYSEEMPTVGFTDCSYKGYARKHNPWVNFTNVSAAVNMPFTSFPQDFSKLPTVSFVIPNLKNDMHDGSFEQADTWLKQHVDAYVTWAMQHNSMLIITWDEDDFSVRNHIPTIIIGPMVRPGRYAQKIDHYNVLRTIEDLYGLPRLGKSAEAAPIRDIWK